MFACYLSDVQTGYEFPLPLLFLKTQFESSTFVLLNFLLKELKAHIQLSSIIIKVKVKQFHCRPGQAQRFPGE
jgi:hypothetical protein